MVGPRKLQVGDIARIIKITQIFDKVYTPNWTSELFTIAKVNITDPVIYKLEDLAGAQLVGSFYEFKIQKAANDDIYFVQRLLHHKRNKVNVLWLGFDKSHYSWIDLKNKP